MFDRIRSALTYANVMATIAFFVALGGGAYATVALPAHSVAAKKHRKRKALPAHSVGTKQLKNKAVTPAKIAPKTMARFKGQKGDRGQPGIQGSIGPSNAYFAQTISSPVSLPVPAGNYVVSGQGFVGNSSGSSVQASCFLSANGIALSAQNGANSVTIPPFPGNGEVSDEGIAHLSAAGTLENTCNGGGGNIFNDAITAIKVDTASP